jgi:hypothetical protein
MDGFTPLSQYALLEVTECREISERVRALEDYWIARAEAGFFTLGAASYLDAAVSQSGYFEIAQSANPVLERSFASVHERIRAFFEELLGAAVFFDHRYALPGFHIFIMRGKDRDPEAVAASAHFDLQWMHLFPGYFPARTISFTLPIDEPPEGSSMEIWHARYSDAVRLGFSGREYARKSRSQMIPCRNGRIVVHDGLVLHAIGRAAAKNPKGLRVTLQGHGVLIPNGWMLYW